LFVEQIDSYILLIVFKDSVEVNLGNLGFY